MPADPAGEIPVRHLLLALPCLLGVAVLSVVLIGPRDSGSAAPPREASPPVVAESRGTTPAVVELPADLPTCPNCGALMVARKNRDTGELNFSCKSPTCQAVAAGAISSDRPKAD